MTTHDLRNSLTKVNKRLILARSFSTQSSVVQEIDGIINDICSIGDRLGDDNDSKAS